MWLFDLSIQLRIKSLVSYKLNQLLFNPVLKHLFAQIDAFVLFLIILSEYLNNPNKKVVFLQGYTHPDAN